MPSGRSSEAAGSTPRDADHADSRAGLQAGMGAIKGAHSELRRQMREQQRLRMLTLMAVIVAVLGALPLFLLVQAANRDPVFTALDALTVPSWATSKPGDKVAGSRWCALECRFRERDMQSTKTSEETNAVYMRALQNAGWTRWKVAGCPVQEVEGHYTCWRRDEYTLDLWVRNTPCTDDAKRNQPTVGPNPSGSAATDPQAVACSGSVVSFKVYNAIADDRLTRPTDQASNPALSPDDLQPSGTAKPSPAP
jgi:integrin beta 3